MWLRCIALALLITIALAVPVQSASCILSHYFHGIHDHLRRTLGPEKIGNCALDPLHFASGGAMQWMDGGLYQWDDEKEIATFRDHEGNVWAYSHQQATSTPVSTPTVAPTPVATPSVRDAPIVHGRSDLLQLAGEYVLPHLPKTYLHPYRIRNTMQGYGAEERPITSIGLFYMRDSQCQGAETYSKYGAFLVLAGVICISADIQSLDVWRQKHPLFALLEEFEALGFVVPRDWPTVDVIVHEYAHALTTHLYVSCLRSHGLGNMSECMHGDDFVSAYSDLLEAVFAERIQAAIIEMLQKE